MVLFLYFYATTNIYLKWAWLPFLFLKTKRIFKRNQFPCFSLLNGEVLQVRNRCSIIVILVWRAVFSTRPIYTTDDTIKSGMENCFKSLVWFGIERIWPLFYEVFANKSLKTCKEAACTHVKITHDLLRASNSVANTNLNLIVAS